jgi:seryl-tRNA synthetase
MIDIKLIRENPDVVRAAFVKRGDTSGLDTILKLDEQYRTALREVEGLRARRNDVNKQLGSMKEKPADLIAEMRKASYRISALEKESSETYSKLQDALLYLPNMVDDSVPVGKDYADNSVVRKWGKVRKFEFKPLPHWEIGENLGIIDFERGVRLSGTRFYVLKAAGALLQRSLISFMLDLHTSRGYTEIYPPFMVKKECLVASGNLPKFADNLYHDAEDDFWFVPTAEVPLTNMHRDEIIPPGALPINYVAHTACFRKEKMAAGKDTRGIKRGHQFDKVELYKFVAPETSFDELEKLTKDAEEVCRQLEIPYRIVQLCTGDLGFASAKSYDIEIWAPGCDEWLEVSSCSNCIDFQARRSNIRYRSEAGEKARLVHTLNGSGVALPRLVISILENYQQADGTVKVPDVLKPYMRMDFIGR